MSFGDFAMGYLVGQSFAGPNMPGDGKTPYEHWSNGAKKEFQKMLDDIGDRAYWEAWDKACKEGVIKRLRQCNEGDNLLTLKRIPIYPNMTQDKQAELIENGELRVVAPCKGVGALGAIWADDTREEAQNPTYKELLKLLMSKVEQGDFRIIV